MSFTKCRYLRDRDCTVTGECCLFWANAELQERCEKSILAAIKTYFSSGALVDVCQNGRCSLTGEACCFKGDSVLRGNCKDRIKKVWVLCQELADERKKREAPSSPKGRG